jgi:threonine dehydrogenase-like Zn-dependent dehydrogenase
LIEETGGGADCVLEVVGSPAATRLAVDCVAPGGVIAAVGVHNEAALAVSPGELYDKNLTYRAGRCPARFYAEELLARMSEERWPLADLVTHRLPLEEGPRAYDLFDRQADGCLKILLQP